MKKLFTTMMLVMIAITTWAYDVEADGIYYNLNSTDKTATVTYKTTSYNSYSGSITIPSSINNEGITYSVTSIGDYAFNKCTELESISLPNSITSIGFVAFYNCTKLTSIILPNSITDIDQEAFENCSSLNSITIPNKVTTICGAVFSGCSGLKSVTIPNSVATIMYEAFKSCTGLTYVIIGNNVTSFGNDVFYGCKIKKVYNQSSLAITKGSTSFGRIALSADAVYSCTSVAQIGNYIFYTDSDGNNYLSDYIGNETNLTLPNNYGGNKYSLAPYAFKERSDIPAITIPNYVTSLGEDVFYGCTSLTSLTIPNSVTSIGVEAFEGCTALASVTIPNTVTSIGRSLFNGCTSLKSLTIPNSITSIPYGICHSCTCLTSLNIPNSVTAIESMAFYSCTALTSIEIPSSVTSIGSQSFQGCSGLTSVTVPNSVKCIGHLAFRDCTGLTTVTIGSSVDSIANYVFYKCPNIKSIYCLATTPPTYKKSVFDSSVLTSATLNVPSSALSAYQQADGWKDFANISAIHENIASGTTGDCTWTLDDEYTLTIKGTGAMADYSSSSSVPWCSYQTHIKSVDICEGVTNISNYAFDGCSGLTSVSIGSSVETIGNSAFESCSTLSSIIIPNSVTSIGQYAFYGCEKISSLIIPKSVTSIGAIAFASCNELTSLKVEEGNSVYDSRDNCNAIIKTSTNELLFGCNNSTIPNTVTRIGYCAFEDCAKITSMVIPNSVTKIQFGGFMQCYGLKSVVIPSTVTSIGNCAFSGCNELESVTNLSTTPQGISSATFGVKNTLYVPKASIESYKSADVWKDFTNISAITVKATSITLDKETASLKAGETSQLTATVLPEDATDKTVTWKSSDTNIATVSEAGLVTAVAEGTATITATTDDGTNLSASCEVSVIHNLTATEAKAATCTEAGNKAYWHCSACEKYFSDAEATTETTLEDMTIAALGHDCQYADNGDDTHKITCSRCDYTTNEAHNFVSGVCSKCGATDSEGDTDISAYNNVIYTNNVEMCAGGNVTLPIKMKNNVAMTGYQFNLYAPSGIDLSTATVTKTKTRKEDNVSFSKSVQADGSLKVVCYTSDSETFSGNDGEVCTVTFQIPTGYAVGDYPIYITNQRLTASGTTYNVDDNIKSTLTVKDYILGDANSNGEVEVGDLSAIVGYILNTNIVSGFNEKAADANCNNEVEVGDLSTIVKMILGTSNAKGMNASTSDLFEMSLTDKVLYPGKEATVYVQMDSKNMSGLQFDITLPEGVTCAGISPVKTRINSDYFFGYNSIEENTSRVLCYSPSNTAISGDTGDIVAVNLKVSDTMASGDYEYTLTNVRNSAGGKIADVTGILHVSDATGINDILSEGNKDAVIYDINGRKIGLNAMSIKSFPKGVYIVNGEKYINK